MASESNALIYTLHEMPAFHTAIADLKCVRPGEPMARLCTVQFAAKMIALVDEAKTLVRAQDQETPRGE